MKFSLKLIGFIPILFLLCSVASAVTVPSNITINLTDVDLTVNNLTFDSVVVGSDSIAFNESGVWSNFTVVPNNPINITVLSWNIIGDYQKSWNKTGNALVSYTVTGHPAHRYAIIENDGNTVQLIGNALGLVAFSSQETGIYTVSLGGDSLPEEHLIEEGEQIEEIKNSFVNSWGNIVSIIGVILIISLAGSALMIFRREKDISSLLEDMPGILLIVVLVIVGAVIFGSFN